MLGSLHCSDDTQNLLVEEGKIGGGRGTERRGG
jgi:hypothetical protein